MKKLRLYGVALLALVAAASCKKTDDADLSGTFNGVETSMGNGKVHSWVTLDGAGDPTAVGFTMTAAALNGLDTGTGGLHGSSVELLMPTQASGTPYKHISIDWNPNGHEPEAIYGLPHFDFHFYMISSADRMDIPPYELDSPKFNNWPAADYFPANYHNFGGGVPMMGAHWLDVLSPELNGVPFTQTFIYGSYNGKVIFMEPMITYDFFKNVTEFTRVIPRPAKVQKTGYYPNTLRITRTGNTYTVSMENMEYRMAS